VSSALGADASASRQVASAEAAAQAGAQRQRSRARVLVDVHGCQAPEAAAEPENAYEREVRVHEPQCQSLAAAVHEAALAGQLRSPIVLPYRLRS